MRSKIRPFLLCALLLSLDAAWGQYSEAKADPSATQTRESQAKTTPAMALQSLKDGNARFTSGKMVKRDLIKQAAAASNGQFPIATVVACLDSRAAPEFVFDQGIGDIFVARVAGNFVNEDIIGSLEFGSKVAGAKLIVVVGHTDCGAIKGACDDVQLGNLTTTLAKIKPAVDAVPVDGSPRNSKNAAFVQSVADMNVKLAVKQILDKSSVLKEMSDKGEIMIVGAMHDLKSGKVTFYDSN